MSVFSSFLYVAQLSAPCIAGNFSLPLTMNGGLFEVVSPTGGRYGSVIINALLCYLPHSAFGLMFVHSVDLLPHTCGRSFGRDFLHCHYGHHDPNQLSGRYRVLRLLNWALSCYNSSSGPLFRLWVHFLMRSRLRGENVYHLVKFSLVLYLSVRDHLVVIDRPSHVCRRIQQRQFSKIRFSFISLALQFGTEIRLCWRWQSLCGAPILRFTSKVGPFSQRRRPRISYNHGLAQMS